MPVLTLRHNGRQLFMPVSILPPSPQPTGNFPLFKALIDTGATVTCISEQVASVVGLRPHGRTTVAGVAGLSTHNSYIFRLGFSADRPDNQSLPAVEAMYLLKLDILGAQIETTGDYDVLLGMDVLSTGQLVVNGSGTFSFAF